MMHMCNIPDKSEMKPAQNIHEKLGDYRAPVFRTSSSPWYKPTLNKPHTETILQRYMYI